MTPTAPFTCVVECPKDKGFIFASIQNVPSCAYKDDQTFFVNLKPVPAIQVQRDEPVPTLEQLQSTHPGNYRKYKEAYDTFQSEFPVVYAKIEKDVELKNAFKSLQEAENARDKSPEAYQTARARYYTLLKGESWVAEEKERVARADVEPRVQQYAGRLEDLTTRINQQQKTVDLVSSVKDKVLSIRDEFRYSVNTLGKQVDEVKNQIQIERKKHEQEEKTSEWTWVDIFLNVCLILVSLFVIYVLYRKLTSSSSSNTLQQPSFAPT